MNLGILISLLPFFVKIANFLIKKERSLIFLPFFLFDRLIIQRRLLLRLQDFDLELMIEVDPH